MSERNEKEHKQLIADANNGLKAIEVLINKYADVTKAVDTTDNEKFDLEKDTAFCSYDQLVEK